MRFQVPVTQEVREVPDPLFPAVAAGSGKEALRFGDRKLTYAELGAVAGALAADLPKDRRVAVWATPTLHTSVAVVAALLAGVPVVPLNPKIGERELGHILADSEPALVLAEPGVELPAALDLPRRDIPLEGDGKPPASEPDAEAPAFIVYTSGTTGPPKGVVLPRRAISSTLDALEDAWQWTADDVLVHGLPLFHVHGLILGILGPLRRGGTVRHLGRFSLEGVTEELANGATMLFGVPTMYHRIAEAVATDEALASALKSARLLVSGSAALPVHDHQRITAATGQQVVERYGMTETLMNTSVRADGERKPGSVGVPLAGVDLRLVDESGAEVTEPDAVGEIQVRGPNLFTEYLNRPDATAAALDGDWFRTGDMATRDPDGYVRIVGRKATDLIKSGGYKIGAGEIENALLEHPNVAEVAVTGEPDDDLGERIVAWVVPDGARPTVEDLADHVSKLLAPHKRPRVVRYLDALPRNDMGKVMKRALG
ncbi:malonyl-CoA/methylmalonyl-CoA synthetase [Amycolatopsis echigonensis]|uniref:Malonyl-CoA/methylmalonyl-CoA synthetase n=1 Tax=Amycolatopsis echigonensis TaxID=2576905 RepID=A0A2N3WDW7_9PSEU|nr:malonyl-CoA/methylmalonyl-CoA synthetase [Amycolatopsis niigatensis]